jgi:hypothetical protein
VSGDVRFLAWRGADLSGALLAWSDAWDAWLWARVPGEAEAANDC